MKTAQGFLPKAKAAFYICKEIRCISIFTGRIWKLEYISSNHVPSVHADFKADGHGNLLWKISLKSYQLTQMFWTIHPPARGSLIISNTLCIEMTLELPQSVLLAVLWDMESSPRGSDDPPSNSAFPTGGWTVSLMRLGRTGGLYVKESKWVFKCFQS